MTRQIIHKLADLPKTPWVDLGELCLDRKQLEGFSEESYGASCWFCEHFWTWQGTQWTCELEGKELKRKRLEAVRCQGQQRLHQP